MQTRPALEIALELRSPRPDLVRALEGLHALVEGTLGGCHGGLGRRLRGWRHGRRVYIAQRRVQAEIREFGSNLKLRSKPHAGRLTVIARFAGLLHRPNVLCAGATRSRCARDHRRCSVDRAARPRSGRRRSGSRNDSVPTATRSCARVEQVARVTPGLDAAHADDRDRDPRAHLATCASATARTAGPDTPPVPPPSHGSPGRRGCMRHAAQRVDERHGVGAVRPPRRPRRRPARALFGVSFTISGLAVARRGPRRAARRSPPGRRP